MESFTVSDSLSSLRLIGIVLLILGFVLTSVVVLVYFWRRSKGNASARTYATILIVISSLIISGGVFYAITGPNSSITVGNRYVTVSGKYIGNETYYTSDIKAAFVENINTGSITLKTRTMGTSLGNINEGRFTLSNGASAYVISDNSTDLVVQLNSGFYLVLGTNNTNALATSFSANVFNVPGY